MADKKITALTALTADGKVAATDLLHIIDYSASPVNKKISVAHLFEKVNCVISSYGAFTHDFGASAAASGLSVVVPNATPAAGAETVVAVNDDGNAFVDFKVETGLSTSALYVDSSLDTDNGSCNTVTINGDFAKVDFRVNSDTSTATTPLLHCDSITHGIAIGKEDPATTHLLDIAHAGSGAASKSIKTSGGVDVTGVSTFTGNTTVTGDITATGKVIHSGVASLNSGTSGDIDVTKHTILLTAGTNFARALPAGVDGQIINFICTTAASGDFDITPSSLNHTHAVIKFDAVGEACTLMFHDSEWNILSLFGATTHAS